MVEQGLCVAVVDPISTGGCIAVEAGRRGFAVIAVWSNEATDEARALRPPELDGFCYLAEIEEQGSIGQTAVLVRQVVAEASLRLLACIVGADTGVGLGDCLAAELGLRGNKPLACGCRRNKHVQQECVRRAGLRAVRGVVGATWSDVAAFVDSESLPLVLKPMASGGSDGVKLCRTPEEAEEHFHLLMHSRSKAEAHREGVLVQEFLKGREFVVDHVSRDGVHKTVNVCYYDKRRCNGAEFVYFGLVLVTDWSTDEVQSLIKYTQGVLDALGIQNGPTHGEIILTADGPCLVEMNCRAIGGEGSICNLQRGLTGYSQVEATLDVYLDDDGACFAQISSVPTFKASGCLIFLVSMREGIVVSTAGLDVIRSLPSFMDLRACPSVGDRVEVTTDLFTNIGMVVLLHADPKVVAKDVERIREMERGGAILTLQDGVAQCPVHFATKCDGQESELTRIRVPCTGGA